jgi:hypothetical protein
MKHDVTASDHYPGSFLWLCDTFTKVARLVLDCRLFVEVVGGIGYEGSQKLSSRGRNYIQADRGHCEASGILAAQSRSVVVP